MKIVVFQCCNKERAACRYADDSETNFADVPLFSVEQRPQEPMLDFRERVQQEAERRGIKYVKGLY